MSKNHEKIQPEVMNLYIEIITQAENLYMIENGKPLELGPAVNALVLAIAETIYKKTTKNE